jgi:dolichyl-phosphate beta-glucosyltransferase
MAVNDSIYISIVIPVWNEEKKIVNDIESINNYFSQKSYNCELIIVDDGSDDKTFELAKEVSVDSSLSKNVIQLTAHSGKGCAVRTGVKASHGKFIMFMDSGGTVPLNYIDNALDILNNSDNDFVIGSRHLPGSTVHHKLIWYRRIVSFMFRHLIKSYLHLPGFLTDTQCGFKVFRGDVGRDLFNASVLDGFLFDLEIILLAIQKNIQFSEMTIEWNWDSDSRLSVVRSASNVYKELYALRKRFS